MQDIIDQLITWLEGGKQVALGRVVAVERKAPREPGAALAMAESGEVLGSVSGGCVEPSVMEAAAETLASGQAQLLAFGISDDEAFGVGLSCGGTVHVFVENLVAGAAAAEIGLLRLLAEAIKVGRPVALVTVLGPADARAEVRAGARLLVFNQAEPGIRGTTGDVQLDSRLAAAALESLVRGATHRLTAGGVDAFIQSFVPPPVLYIIGAVHPAGALAAAARFAGFRVVVCDPRSPFATPDRLPDAHEIVRQWPDDYLSGASLSQRDAVCVLTHDLKFDVPAIQTALSSPVGYIGVMGSRGTHARRVKALREAGVPEEALARLKAPIGLDIGARTPQEMSISILAEIIGNRRTHPPAGSD